jgi:ABC-type multidrug transport system ATPase subunit
MNDGAVLRLEDVSKDYGADVTAVSDVSLAVEPGEFVLVMGPSDRKSVV